MTVQADSLDDAPLFTKAADEAVAVFWVKRNDPMMREKLLAVLEFARSQGITEFALDASPEAWPENDDEY